jgi:hypothetical protein
MVHLMSWTDALTFHHDHPFIPLHYTDTHFTSSPQITSLHFTSLHFSNTCLGYYRFGVPIVFCKYNLVQFLWWRNDMRHSLLITYFLRYFRHNHGTPFRLSRVWNRSWSCWVCGLTVESMKTAAVHHLGLVWNCCIQKRRWPITVAVWSKMSVFNPLEQWDCGFESH